MGWRAGKGGPEGKICPHKGIPDFPDYNTVNVSRFVQYSPGLQKMKSTLGQRPSKKA